MNKYAYIYINMLEKVAKRQQNGTPVPLDSDSVSGSGYKPPESTKAKAPESQSEKKTQEAAHSNLRLGDSAPSGAPSMLPQGEPVHIPGGGFVSSRKQVSVAPEAKMSLAGGVPSLIGVKALPAKLAPSKQQIAAFLKGTNSRFDPSSRMDKFKMERLIKGDKDWASSDSYEQSAKR